MSDMLNFRNYTPKKAQYSFQEIAPVGISPVVSTVPGKSKATPTNNLHKRHQAKPNKEAEKSTNLEI